MAFVIVYGLCDILVNCKSDAVSILPSVVSTAVGRIRFCLRYTDGEHLLRHWFLQGLIPIL